MIGYSITYYNKTKGGKTMKLSIKRTNFTVVTLRVSECMLNQAAELRTF